MGPKKSAFARHALSALRMALVWARKGGALKRTNPKWLQASSRAQSGMARYGERQLSLDDGTSAFHVKMHRPASVRLNWVSCVNPSIVEFDDHEDRDIFKWMSKEDYMICEDEDDVEREVCSDDSNCESESGCEMVCIDEAEINSKADEFIAKFYAEMRLQRQISCVHYDEMLEI